MSKIYTANKETGMFIEEVQSIEEAIKLIEEYEEIDKEEGNFKEGFYDIVDEEHSSFNIFD